MLDIGPPRASCAEPALGGRFATARSPARIAFTVAETRAAARAASASALVWSCLGVRARKASLRTTRTDPSGPSTTGEPPSSRRRGRSTSTGTSLTTTVGAILRSRSEAANGSRTSSVSAAASFLRRDDESALTELVHAPLAASLRLRRIAPTVVVSDVPVEVLLPRLRELGGSPVVEGPDGSVRVVRKDALRARTPRQDQTSADADAARAAARVSATVNAIRAGDRAVANRPPNAGSAQLARGGPMSNMALLRESVESRSTVWIGYVDSHGSTVEMLVDPVKVEGGWLTAFDHRSDSVRSFAIHRITAVAAMTGP